MSISRTQEIARVRAVALTAQKALAALIYAVLMPELKKHITQQHVLDLVWGRNPSFTILCEGDDTPTYRELKRWRAEQLAIWGEGFQMTMSEALPEESQAMSVQLWLDPQPAQP